MHQEIKGNPAQVNVNRPFEAGGLVGKRSFRALAQLPTLYSFQNATSWDGTNRLLIRGAQLRALVHPPFSLT